MSFVAQADSTASTIRIDLRIAPPKSASLGAWQNTPKINKK